MWRIFFWRGGITRQREMAVRTALGADRRKFIATAYESAFLAFAARSGNSVGGQRPEVAEVNFTRGYATAYPASTLTGGSWRSPPRCAPYRRDFPALHRRCSPEK